MKRSKTPSKRSKEVARLIKRAVALDAKIEAMKALYTELDEVTLRLNELNFVQHVSTRHVVTLVDNFASKNVAFRTTAIRRFEIRISREAKKGGKRGA